MTTNELLQQFESGDLDPHAFDHRAHIAAAIALLRQAPYLEAVERYVAGSAGSRLPPVCRTSST